MDNQNRLELRPQDLEYLYIGLLYFKPESLGKTLTKGEFEKLRKIYGDLNQKFFFNLVFTLTSSVSIEEAAKKIERWRGLAKEGKVIHPLAPLRDTDIYKIRELTDIAEQPPSNYEKVLEKTSQEVEASIKQLKERQKKMNANQLKPQADKVYLEPEGPEEKIKLTEKQKKIIKLVHQDPKKFRDELVKKIVTNSKGKIPPEKIQTSAEIVANSFVLKNLGINPNAKEITIDNSPFELLTAFADPNSENVKKMFPKSDQAFAFSAFMQAVAKTEAKDTFKSAEMINKAVGVNFSPFFIPSRIRNVKVTTKETNKSSSAVEVKKLITEVNEAQNLKRQIITYLENKNPEIFAQLTKAERIKIEEDAGKIAFKQGSITKAFNYLRFGKFKGLPQVSSDFTAPPLQENWLDVHLSQMGIPKLSQGMQFWETPTSFSPNSIFPSQLTNIAFDKIISKISGVSKLNRVVTGMGSKIGKKVVKKITKKLLTKVGTKIAALLGEQIIPVIGQILSVIQIGFESIKTILPRIKKNYREFMTLLIGSWVAGMAAVAAAFMGIAAVIFTVFILPILIALIAIPVAVAIIFFIINSGAYMVPPGTGASISSSTSPYIKVTKIPFPSGPFENTDLPLEITYQVTIQALKGTLSNIQIKESCSVTKKTNSPPCPNPDPEIPDGSQIDEITPTSPYVFTYKKSFTSPDFEDTLTVDIITVTADTPENPSITSAGSASVIIGKPPINCPSGWPIMPEFGFSSLPITQGPNGTYSHKHFEAIDIGTQKTIGFTVTARHNGTILHTDAVGSSGWGKYVDIQSTCKTGQFVSRYAHLSSVKVNVGQKVVLGQVIGLSGNTGNSTDPHLHYGFRGPDGYGRKGPYPNNDPYMHKSDDPNDPPDAYIPKNVPYGCSSNCGVSIP